MSYSFSIGKKMLRVYDTYDHLLDCTNEYLAYYSYGRLCIEYADHNISDKKMIHAPITMAFDGIEYRLKGVTALSTLVYVNKQDQIYVSPSSLEKTCRLYVSRIYATYDGILYYRNIPIRAIAGIQGVFIDSCNLESFIGFIGINGNVHQFKAHKTSVHVYPEIYLRGFQVVGQTFVRTIEANILRDVYCDIILRTV